MAAAAEHRAVRGPPIMALPRTGNSSTSNGHASSVGGDHCWKAATTRPTRPTPAAYTNGQRRLRLRKVISTGSLETPKQSGYGFMWLRQGTCRAKRLVLQGFH